MNQSRLYLFYQQLSTKQVREFRDFVVSPFFNKKDYIMSFNHYLATQVSSKKGKFDKKIAFQKMYPGTKYDDQKMRLAMSSLLKLLEQYIAHKSLVEDEFEGKIRLLRFCRQQLLPKHFDYTLRNLKDWQEKKKEQNADYFDARFQILQEEFLQHHAEQRKGHNLQEVNDMIDLAYLTRKLQQTCYLLSRQTVWQGDTDQGMLQEAFDYINRKDLLNVPAIAVYYFAYQALSQPKEESAFKALKQQIVQHGQNFPIAEIRDLYLLAINFCIRSGNQGHKNYFREGLDLYKEGLNQGYLLQKGELSRFTFNNAVAMSLKIADYQWAEQFIQEHKFQLDKKHREHAVSYSLARLEYARKNYDAALPLLQKVEYKDLLTNLNAKVLLLRIYWELDEHKLFNAHLDAMHIFLRRKSVIGYHRTNYENIIKYARKLLTINFFDKEAVQVFRRELEQEEVLSAREWFLTQCDFVLR